MAKPYTPPVGSIGWHDLTVRNAKKVRSFYEKVVGWTSKEFDGDFNMFAQDPKAPVAGICHAKGPNANLPPVWLPYIVVADLAKSIRTATRLGGTVVDGPRAVGNGGMCVLRDPGGAFIALFQNP